VAPDGGYRGAFQPEDQRTQFLDYGRGKSRPTGIRTPPASGRANEPLLGLPLRLK
jgi:hypothetical protein